MIRIRLMNPTIACEMAKAWGYWRKIEEWEMGGPWIRDEPWTMVCWMTEMPKLDPNFVSVHLATKPGTRREKGWLTDGVQVLWTIAALGEVQRIYAVLPETEKDLRWRALRRYLGARGWTLDEIGAYLQVLEPEDLWASSFPRSLQ